MLSCHHHHHHHSRCMCLILSFWICFDFSSFIFFLFSARYAPCIISLSVWAAFVLSTHKHTQTNIHIPSSNSIWWTNDGWLYNVMLFSTFKLLKLQNICFLSCLTSSFLSSFLIHSLAIAATAATACGAITTARNCFSGQKYTHNNRSACTRSVSKKKKSQINLLWYWHHFY